MSSSEILPWQIDGNPWNTESKFITWIRGVLRKGWSKHPLKLEYIKRYRKRIANPNTKGKTPTVWGMTCEMCQKDTVQANIEIDHRGEQGKFTTMSEIEGYARHLFMISYDSIRAVCKGCHKIISHSQRKGISFDEAALEKEVIEICGRSVQEVVDFCVAHEYNECMLSNSTKRREAVTNILRKIT